MKNTIIIAVLALISLSLTSCSNSEQTEKPLDSTRKLCVSDFKEYGNIHNAFMDNVLNN